jgi:hypothetical protein
MKKKMAMKKTMREVSCFFFVIAILMCVVFILITEVSANPADPTVDIISLNGEVTFFGKTSICVQIDADVGLDRVEYFVDGIKEYTDNSPSSTSSYLWDTTTVIDGLHTLKIVVYDIDGQSGSVEKTMNVDNSIGKILVIDDTTTDSEGKSVRFSSLLYAQRGVSYAICSVGELNSKAVDPTICDACILMSDSLDNLNFDIKKEITSEPLVVVADENEIVDFTGIGMRYDGNADIKSIDIYQLPDYYSTPKSPSVVYTFDKDQFDENVQNEIQGEMMELLPGHGEAYAVVTVIEEVGEGNYVWATVGAIDAISGKIVVYSAPFCAVSWEAGGGACWITAGATVTKAITTSAQLFRDTIDVRVEECNLPSCSLSWDQINPIDSNLKIMRAEAAGGTIDCSLYYEYDETLGYPVLRSNSPSICGGSIKFPLVPSPDDYFVVDNEYLYGLCTLQQPYGTAIDFREPVKYKVGTDGQVSMELVDNELVICDENTCVQLYDFTEQSSSDLVLNPSGLQGTQYLFSQPGFEVNFNIDNDGEVTIDNYLEIEKGLDWLRTQRKVDGDHVYWTYQGTPNVGVTALVTLAFLNHGYDESDPTVSGALNWLVAQANEEDGSISCDTRKVYDTSLAILPLVAAQNEAKYGNVIASARKYLISVQNDEGTGYDRSDRFYGGWGYPKDNWADLSNTQFVVMALDAAGGLTGNVKGNALTFVTRCQNRKESNSEYSSYDDGGFVYQPKSGAKSRGSMTAAGLWGLFLCGVGKNDGRVQDALGWLDERSVEENDPIGNKWVYYYDLGLAKAYLMAEARGCEFGKTNWYEDLYAFLSDKQDKKDGHWHNIEGEHSCDALATAEAILALSVKEVPERISKLSYMVFKLRSAADLHIYDPEGRHVGLNTETGEVEIGIPDATYTENPIEIKVPNLEAGGYKAELIGTEAGEYELEVIAKTGNKTLAEASYEGWITEGTTQEMITTISSIVGPLDVRLGTLEAVVEEEDSYSEQFSLDAGDELEIDAIDETGVLLRIEAEEDCEGEVKIMVYSENPTIKGFPGEYKYCALGKYVEISLDVDREKIDWPIYLEVHYDEGELPENVDESTLTIYHYLNDTKWRSCNDFEVNLEENYISAELEKDELSYFGMGGLYAPIWERYSMILIVIAIVIVLALGYFSVRRYVKSRRVKAMKVPERVPAEVAITIYNFDNSFRLLKEREEAAKISDGLDGRLASGEIKEETYNDLKSKYESKISDLNRKIKSELERANAYLQRIEDERTKLQRTHESLNAELQKEKGRKKKAEISAKVAEISAEIERVDGIIKTMKEKIAVIEVGGSGY